MYFLCKFNSSASVLISTVGSFVKTKIVLKNLCCFIVVHDRNRANQEWKHEKRLRWLSYCTFCLFNLEDCDITYVSRGAISCHWGSVSALIPHPSAFKYRTWFTQATFMCVSDGETQYPHGKFLPGQTGKWRPITGRISKPWLSTIGWFEK